MCTGRAPDLWRILSTPHSKLNVFEWGNPECGVWILSVEFWVSIINFGSRPWTYDDLSVLYTLNSSIRSMYLNENLKVWMDSHSTLRNPQSNTWSVECWVSLISLGPENKAISSGAKSCPASPSCKYSNTEASSSLSNETQDNFSSANYTSIYLHIYIYKMSHERKTLKWQIQNFQVNISPSHFFLLILCITRFKQQMVLTSPVGSIVNISIF